MANNEAQRKQLAEAYASVDEAASAFMRMMEQVVPLYIKWIDARNQRDTLKAQYAAQMFLKSTKNE